MKEKNTGIQNQKKTFENAFKLCCRNFLNFERNVLNGFDSKDGA